MTWMPGSLTCMFCCRLSSNNVKLINDRTAEMPPFLTFLKNQCLKTNEEEMQVKYNEIKRKTYAQITSCFTDFITNSYGMQ